MSYQAACLVCAALGLAFAGPADAAPAFDGVTGATVITPPASAKPTSVLAKVKAAGGSRAKGSFTGTLTARKGQFTSTLKLPLPNAASGIIDVATAQSADLVVELDRQGQSYVRCDLVFTVLNKKPRLAKFGISALKRNGVVQQQTGVCELTIPPYGTSLPTPQARDSLTITAIGTNGDQVLATGVFVKN